LEIHPAISPDGNMVAYAAGPLYQTKIYVQQISGGRAVPLTDEPTLLVRHFDPGVYHRQDFASGAGQFFFTLTEHESDIWVMELESQD